MRRNRPHKDLRLWQKSIDLVARVYGMTSAFPKHQAYVLGAQSQRAAISVPSNIAEGLAKPGPRDRSRFLRIAQGSLSELDTQVELAMRLGFVASELYEELMDRIEEVQMLLSGLLRSLSKE
jgi:four helix bundle protein